MKSIKKSSLVFFKIKYLKKSKFMLLLYMLNKILDNQCYLVRGMYGKARYKNESEFS